LESNRDGRYELTTAPPSVIPRLVGLLRAARPGQWVKNLACFAGLIFSGQLFYTHAVVQALLAFMGFCLAASAVYLLNDVVDRRLDCDNPSKKMRPIASGLVPPSWALLTSLQLTIAAIGSSLFLSSLCTGLIVVYLLTNVAYSIRFKHTVLLDVVLIALGFVLRVLYGVYAVGVKPTSWIVLCMFFLALFLGFAKRRGELNLADGREPFNRPVLRKYRIGFLDTLLAMSATMAILCYSIYTVTGRQGNATLVVTVPLVVYGVTRYMLQVMVYDEGEAPERLLVSDPMLLGITALWAVLCIAIIYSKIHILLD
jgi:4-hydroxybenzoate polyprenyltransferase